MLEKDDYFKINQEQFQNDMKNIWLKKVVGIEELKTNTEKLLAEIAWNLRLKTTEVRLYDFKQMWEE